MPDQIQDLSGVILSGPSSEARKLKAGVEGAVASSSPVLIYGEPGAGKETIARLIHSKRPSKNRFLACYVAEESEENLKKILDRHANLGPGAKSRRNTIFFDAVDDLSSRGQNRLAQFLKSQDLVRGPRPKVIATSTQDLFALVKYGAFSRDLYWHLNVLRLSLPNLRHRKADIPVIFNKLLKTAYAPDKAPKPGRPAIKTLAGYAWPGNLREMRSIAERLKASGQSGKLTRKTVTRLLANPLTTETGMGRGQNLSSAIYRNLEKYFKAHETSLPPPGLYGRIIKEVERPLISLALNATGGNQLKAAKLLGLNRNTLRKKLKNLGIKPKDLKT